MWHLHRPCRRDHQVSRLPLFLHGRGPPASAPRLTNKNASCDSSDLSRMMGIGRLSVPKGWTVFQIPSTRSVSETPSTPGIAVGAASCSRRGTPEFPRSQTFPTFPRLRPDGLASAAARTNTRLRRRPPRPGGEQKHAGRRLVPCLRRSVARSGGRAPFLVLGPRACPGA